MPAISQEAMRDIKIHVRDHVSYPVSKGELISACSKMAEIPQAEKDWFRSALPEGVYSNPDEVMRALNLG